MTSTFVPRLARERKYIIRWWQRNPEKEKTRKVGWSDWTRTRSGYKCILAWLLCCAQRMQVQTFAIQLLNIAFSFLLSFQHLLQDTSPVYSTPSVLANSQRYGTRLSVAGVQSRCELDGSHRTRIKRDISALQVSPSFMRQNSSNYITLLYTHLLQNIKWPSSSNSSSIGSSISSSIVLDSQIQIAEENQTFICRLTHSPPRGPRKRKQIYQTSTNLREHDKQRVKDQQLESAYKEPGGKPGGKSTRTEITQKNHQPAGGWGADGRSLNIARRRWPMRGEGRRRSREKEKRGGKGRGERGRGISKC